MEIVTLIENHRYDRRFDDEFGLSLLIKSSGTKILFDMGASGKFIKNARKLGEDLSDMDFAVLSHAHYDHGGGLIPFFEINGEAKVHMGEGADGEFYACAGAVLPDFINRLVAPVMPRSERLSKYVGIDRTVFREHSHRVEFVSGVRELAENVFILTEIQRNHPIPDGNVYLLEKRGGELFHDRFAHELILVVREADGLVIFTGCGHCGILNMVETVREHFGDERIKGVVGGFHLNSKAPGTTRASAQTAARLLAENLLKQDVGRVYTGHCTGMKAYGIMKEVMKERLNPVYTGAVIDL